MADRSSGAAAPADRTLVIRRVFDASQDLVFESWANPEHAIRWWGPKDFTVPSLELDARVGGAWRAHMRSPEGKDYRQHGVVREIVRPHRLVFTFIWDEEPDHEMLVTVTFTDRGGKTEVHFRQDGFHSVEERDSHREGWSECFDRLETFLADRGAK